MAQRTQLKANKRELFGRKINRLRREGILPANLFGNNIKSQALQVDTASFTKVYQQEGETGLVDLVVDTKNHPVLIGQIHNDPVSGKPLHVDFRQVNLKEKVTANIPVEIVGESPAIKEKDGVLVTPLDEIEVEALPTDLPESIQVDISGLKNIGDSITVADLKVGDKVEIQTDPETPIVLIQEQRAEEEEPETVEAEGEEAVATPETPEADDSAQASDKKAE